MLKVHVAAETQRIRKPVKTPYTSKRRRGGHTLIRHVYYYYYFLLLISQRDISEKA